MTSSNRWIPFPERDILYVRKEQEAFFAQIERERGEELNR